MKRENLIKVKVSDIELEKLKRIQEHMESSERELIDIEEVARIMMVIGSERY